MARMVMEGLLRPLARPSVLLVLVGLAITGYGMGVIFHGDSGVYFVGMKTDRIRTDITDIVFVFVFMSGFRFEYG
jgi:hypothetical protein